MSGAPRDDGGVAAMAMVVIEFMVTARVYASLDEVHPDDEEGTQKYLADHRRQVAEALSEAAGEALCTNAYFAPTPALPE